MRALEALTENPRDGSLKNIAARARLVKISSFRILYTL